MSRQIATYAAVLLLTAAELSGTSSPRVVATESYRTPPWNLRRTGFRRSRRPASWPNRPPHLGQKRDHPEGRGPFVAAIFLLSDAVAVHVHRRPVRIRHGDHDFEYFAGYAGKHPAGRNLRAQFLRWEQPGGCHYVIDRPRANNWCSTCRRAAVVWRRCRIFPGT